MTARHFRNGPDPCPPRRKPRRINLPSFSIRASGSARPICTKPRCRASARIVRALRAVSGAVCRTPNLLTLPYSRDWGEVGTREILLEAVRAHLIETPVGKVGPGALILFRMEPGTPAKHCGVLGPSLIRPSFIHACDRSGVVEEPLANFWARPAAYAFPFPATASAEA